MICLLMNLFMSLAFSQYNTKLFQIENEIANGKLKKASARLEQLNPNELPIEDKALFYFLKAKLDGFINEEDKAYKNYLKSKDLYLKIDSIDKVMKINLELAYLVNSLQSTYNVDSQIYLDEYLKYAGKQKDSLILAQANAEIASMKINPEEAKESLEYFFKAKAINKNVKNKELESLIDNNLAALYNEYLNRPDSALFYFKKNLNYIKTLKNNNYDLCVNYINQGAANSHLKNYAEAIRLLNIADTIPIKEYNKSVKSFIYKNLSINYAAIKNFNKAYETYLLHQTYQDSLNEEEQSLAIKDIQTKYQTNEIKLKNRLLSEKNKTTGILLYTFIGLLAASLVIGFLIIKNSRKRERITRQEKLIEQQKLEKALKEYELGSIDLMLEGQEKERQRIANDLHDNLGSMLATLKLNFENLKLRKNELRHEENKLYERTDELIEEAYQKVRRLAHSKNAGVFASQGLIPAIKKLAEKLSIPGKLKIDVIEFGFKERLENTIEIAVFRMIQELATNIIKHSGATEGAIHLTHHDNNINIIIEDNGVGFDSSKIKENDGMGLSTIRKKIEQLGGSLSIDSTPGKGTTVIIDIPV